MLKLAGAVLVVVLAGYGAGVFLRWLDRQWFLKAAWHWLSGGDGFGRGKRAARHCGSMVAAVAWVWGWLTAPVAAMAVTCAALAALAGLGGWRLWRLVADWRANRVWYRPLHLAARDIAQLEEWRKPRSWITLTLDKNDAVEEARLALPSGWAADPKEEQKLIATAAARLGIEAPEASWRRAGPAPQLVLTHSEPPPSFVEYGKDELGLMLAEAVAKAASNEIVVGLGKPDKGTGKPKVVKASLSLDSPHFAINMGSGAGKSTLAAFWVMQELRRGAIVMVLDSKQFSHPWLFKDEHGEYSQLPNVSYLWTPPQIHAGMIWLGTELHRRNDVARRAVDATGRLRGDVGPRLIVLAEELNYATPQLREHWKEIRIPAEPNKSPALTSFGAVSFAGRAVKMHLFLVGQMLTADVTGSKDSSVKENVGVTAMARYGPPGWATAIGKNVPMPPCPDVMGRIQLVTAGKTREVQTPLADYLAYRELATSGTVTPCPAGMPGISVPARPELPAPPSEQPVVLRTGPYLGLPGMTKRELVEQRIVSCSLDALRKASQRPGFPAGVGWRGQAELYDPVAVAAWDAGRR